MIVRTYKGTTHCAEAIMTEPGRIIHNYESPLSCGAKVWIETPGPVVAVLGDGKEVQI